MTLADLRAKHWDADTIVRQLAALDAAHDAALDTAGAEMTEAHQRTRPGHAAERAAPPGLGLRVAEGTQVVLVATLDTPRGRIELR